MASETITQNDLREILSRTVGSVPSEYKKLLWSNPNPTANFPTQALLNGEDLTVYDAIEVIGINYSGYKSIMPPLQIPIGGKGNLIGLAGSTGDSAGMGFLVMRGISVNTNSIVVSGAMGVSTNGASWSANDNNMIPYKIYGIKYERVAPPQVEYPNYSTEEQQVGTWITGKPLYRKVMPIQSLPNNTTAVYAHGISNIGVVSRFTLCWYDTNDARFIMSPRIDAGGPRCTASMNSTNVIIEATGTNWSTRTRDVFFIVEYTKTTD